MRHQPRSWQSHLKECRRLLVGRKKIHLAQPLVVRDSYVTAGASLLECEPCTQHMHRSEYVSTAEKLGASVLISNTTCHTNSILVSLARVKATSTRTAEVTFSIDLDSYRTPSRHCIIQLVRAVSGGIVRVLENCEEGLGVQ